MKINWSAVLAGFGVTLVLGLISGLIYAGSNATVVVLYWGVIGVLGGLTAGYLSGGTMGDGGLNGGVATVFGSLLVLAFATFTGLLFAGIVPALGVLTFGLLMLAVYAIPGVIGGVIGSWAKGRRTVPKGTVPQA